MCRGDDPVQEAVESLLAEIRADAAKSLLFESATLRSDLLKLRIDLPTPLPLRRTFELFDQRLLCHQIRPVARNAFPHCLPVFVRSKNVIGVVLISEGELDVRIDLVDEVLEELRG